MSTILTIVIVIAALVLGIGLAYVPMRLLLYSMAKNIKQFIQRTRDRRQVPREGAADRRTVEVVTPPPATEPPVEP